MNGMSEIKKEIVSAYDLIAEHAKTSGSKSQREKICSAIFEPIAELYTTFPGYKDEANLGLGCGFPFNFIDIKPGDICLDLGCASGVDSFIMQNAVGDSGMVYGLDITPTLTDRATQIAQQYQLKNIKFITGDIEHLPFEDNSIDKITSNGVFSLLPNISKAFSEMFRVMKPGGKFCIADITQQGNYLPSVEKIIYEFTGCLNGIRHKEFYIQEMLNAGFVNVEVKQKRTIILPESLIDLFEKEEEVLDIGDGEKGLDIVLIIGEKFQLSPTHN